MHKNFGIPLSVWNQMVVDLNRPKLSVLTHCCERNLYANESVHFHRQHLIAFNAMLEECTRMMS